MQALYVALGQPNIDAVAVAVAELAGTPLVLQSENRPINRDMNARPLPLADGVAMDRLDVRQSRTKSWPPFVVVGLQGRCITVDGLQRHVTELTLPEPPPHPVSSASITRTARLAGKPISLGFRWSHHDCLHTAVPRPRPAAVTSISPPGD